MIGSTLRLVTMACCVLIICGRVTFAAEYHLSMLPTYSTEEINKRITPFAQYLSKETGLTITPTLAVSFDQYSKRLVKGDIDIGFENPYIYVLASKAHEVVAMAEKGEHGDKFRGIIITRKGSPIKVLDDLLDKKIAIVGYTSAGGYLSQNLTLLENDIDIKQDCTIEEAPENKQENVIFSVYTGEADAGFIRESALHKADDFVPPGSVTVLDETAWLPNWALSISRNMDPEDREKIVKAVKALQPGSPILAALKINKFRPAEDSEYDPVRKAAGMMSPAPAVPPAE